jgi:hypothetical protein
VKVNKLVNILNSCEGKLEENAVNNGQMTAIKFIMKKV